MSIINSKINHITNSSNNTINDYVNISGEKHSNKSVSEYQKTLDTDLGSLQLLTYFNSILHAHKECKLLQS